VWSPDTKQIAFNRAEGIWIIGAERGSARELKLTVRGGAPMNWAPAKWLIFACDRPGGIGTCAQLLTGSRSQRLLGGAEGGFPAWRP